METALPLIFVFVMGLSLLLYVILDGYDLGVGLLLPFGNDQEKDVMIASIGPFWDANETWIVMGVGVLLIAFPSAHGIILTELYFPATVMLLGLILRGVAFDFRVKAGDDKKAMWNRIFFIGSLVASMAQGWMLGSYITGLNGSLINTVFSILIAFCLPALYCVLGSTWLLVKTEGELFAKAVGWARKSVLPMTIGLFLVSIATPLVSKVIADRWFHDVEDLRILNPWYLFICPVIVCLMAALGLAYSIFPDIIIGQMTIWESAAHTQSLLFTFYGVAVALPCIICYTIFMYRVFSGKATELSYD